MSKSTAVFFNDNDGQDPRMDEERWVGSKDVACMWICTRKAPFSMNFEVVCFTKKKIFGIDWRVLFSPEHVRLKVGIDPCRVSWGVRFAPLDLIVVFILSHSCSCRRFELLFLRETHMCVICPDVCHFFSFSLFCVWVLILIYCAQIP